MTEIITIVALGLIAWISLRYRPSIAKFFTNNSTLLLDGFWYLFIIGFIGQLGPFIGYASAYWFGKDLMQEIQKSAGKAELITCATAILAGGTFFLVKEYNSSHQINDRKIKSVLILVSASLGLACIGVTAQLLANNGFDSDRQKFVHWVLYFLALAMAFVLWAYEEIQGTAVQAIQKIKNGAEEITEQSKSSTEIDGVKI